MLTHDIDIDAHVRQPIDLKECRLNDESQEVRP